MKKYITLCLFFSCFNLFSQSYVDSGIRHYIASEFKEALKDFNEAGEMQALFTASSVAKLHHYWGMTKFNMIEGEKDVSEEMIKEIVVHLTKANEMDSSWAPTSESAFEALYEMLMEDADALLKEERKAKELEEKVELLNTYLDKLSLAYSFNNNPEIELLQAQTYHEIGDLYFEDAGNVVQLQKAGEYYTEAIKHYEVARYADPFSKEIIEAVLGLSKKMDDPERVAEYSKLLELAGG